MNDERDAMVDIACFFISSFETKEDKIDDRN